MYECAFDLLPLADPPILTDENRAAYEAAVRVRSGDGWSLRQTSLVSYRRDDGGPVMALYLTWQRRAFSPAAVSYDDLLE